jgi:hypothetical protein
MKAELVRLSWLPIGSRGGRSEPGSYIRVS